jgi:pimeloyl-ACP methyl ester carboxylesterase
VRLLTIRRAAPAMSCWRFTVYGGNAAVLEVDDASNGSSAPHTRRHHGAGAGLMTTVEANGVTLGVEHFGEAAAPLILLAGGTTMLSWPDALCEALARGGRHVVRYDLRDSGASSIIDPEAPTYTLRDLAADAAALARELDDRPAHLAGIGVGGMVAQVAALDYPDAFSALTLAGTRPVAPGRVDEDLPDHDAATMERLFSRPMPDWSDRAAVAEFATAGAEILGNDPVAARATAERIWDRTPTTEPAVQMANQMAMVFSKLDCQPRWRERLSELAIPTLVIHGRRDPFFPVGNGEALAREIPDARLLVLERAATAIPDAAASEVAAAMLAL